MFQQNNLGVVGFESNWKKEKSTKNQSLQTSEFSTRDKNLNTNHSKSIEVQTDPVKSEKNFEIEKLAKWLDKIYPKMSSKLNDNTFSSAFASLQNFKPSTANIKVLQKISTNFEKEKIHVSALSWSCTGNTLAVASSFKHDVWCYHESEIKIYSYNRAQKLPELPNKNLKCSSCVTALSFHPNQPSILCSGTFSGEIYLWCLKKETDNLLSSNAAHDDRITQISWVQIADNKLNYTLVSTSLDAFLLTWKINDSNLVVDQRYKCRNYSMKVYNSSVEMIPPKTDRGLVAFDFSAHYPGVFIVGTEGGYILKCSLIGAKLVPNNKMTNTSFFDPFVRNFASHHGEVSCIIFSPHRKEVFLSCGTDDQVKIFHIDQESPVQIIFTDVPITVGTWISCEEKLLAIAAENGCLKLYSLLNGQEISIDANFTNQPLTSIAINHKRRDILVVGNSEANVTLWSIPWNEIALSDKQNVLKSQ